MRPRDTIARSAEETVAKDDTANAQEAQRRWSSGLMVGLLVFVIAYALFASAFERWGLALGWMPSSAIAAALGWVGYCFPWIGEAIAILWDLLSLLAIFS